MFYTGNGFLGYFVIITAFIPLMPVLLVIIRRSYRKEPLNFLTIICLLGFLKALFALAPSLNPENQAIIHNIFSLLLFGLFVQLFKSSLAAPLQYLLTIFLAAFLSSVITYGAIKGWDLGHFPLDGLLSGILALLIFVCLPSIVQSARWQVFHAPLFWIAGGTLFYLLIFLLLEWTGPFLPMPVPPPDPEKALFLAIADFIRYFLYVVAVLACRQEKPEAGAEEG